MLRILIAIAVAAAPLAAAGRDQKLEQSIQRVRARAAGEAPPLAADTYLRIAELVRGTNPAVARECVLAALESLRQVREAGSNELRALRLLMSIDPAEGERVALAPGKAAGYIAVIDHWLGAGDMGRAAARLRLAWRNGVWFRDSARMIGKVRETDPDAALALYRDLLEQLPAEQSALHASVLMECSRGMAAQAPEEARRGFARLLAAVTPEKFNAGERQETVATFKLAGKSIQTDDTRETFLLPLGVYLRQMDPAAYEKHQKLFAKWRDDIAAVKPEDVERATAAGTTLFAARADLPKLRARAAAEPRAPREEQKLPFAEALAKARGASEAVRPYSYYQLLERTDLTREQQMQAAREMLPVLPGVRNGGARLSMASDLFRMAAEGEWKGLVQPAAAALTGALRDLTGCETKACEFERSRRETPRAYAALAAGVRRSGIRVKDGGASFLARTALLDLKDILDEQHDFEISGINGEPFRLLAQRGRVVMLNFWATW